MEYYIVVYEDGHQHNQIIFQKAESPIKAKVEVEKLSHCMMVLSVYQKVWDKVSELGREY